MRFFDSNVYFGLPMRGALAPVANAQALLAEMDRAGIEKALVWHIAQMDCDAAVGNQLLADEIASHPRLVGCWALLPSQTHELPPPNLFFKQMMDARVNALRLFPAAHRFLFETRTLSPWLEPLEERGIPLLLSVTRGVEWREIYTILEAFPELVCVICDHGSWGMDRLFRPLLESYPNVYIELSRYFLDGGIESLAARYGAERMLFGSGFPEGYQGTMMLTLQHANISMEDKSAIAAENLERILAEVAW